MRYGWKSFLSTYKELIQLEGLVGGKVILNNIKNENNLCKVLIENNVEVYLTKILIGKKW